MKKTCIFLLLSITSLIFISPVFAIDNNNQQLLTSQTQQSIQDHMRLLNEFKSMYENKYFDTYLFDINKGYLQTSVGNNEKKMPLNFFVEYNNMWWFAIIDKVVVPSIGYDYENNTGFIVLDIYYDKKRIFRGTQYIKFSKDKINYIRTYASPAFFTENQDSPLVKLDSYGNQIWLTTGYDLDHSVKLALAFLKSPDGQLFIHNNKTKLAMKKIQENLNHYNSLFSHKPL